MNPERDSVWCYGANTGLLLIDVAPGRGAVSRETTAVIAGRTTSVETSDAAKGPVHIG